MEKTDYFAPLRNFFRPLTSRYSEVRACTLCKLEEWVAGCLPETVFPPKAEEKTNSRDRIYTPKRTFFCLLWQCLQPECSGREVVRQLQALFQLKGGPKISEADTAYCRARARLPQSILIDALGASGRAADQCSGPSHSGLRGRPLKVVDGTTVLLPDTKKNRSRYPAVQSSPPNFPLMRLVVLFSLASGAALALAQGSLHESELALFQTLFAQLVRGDIVIGDRGFGCYTILALLQGLGVDFVGRTTRRLDPPPRKQRLGPDQWLMTWSRPTKASPWVTLATWMGLPTQVTVRVVRAQVTAKGMRVRQVCVVTTLLDSTLYPAEEILAAYLQRWRLEICLNDLKTTLQMQMLRGRSPASVQQEAYARFLAHNLIRWTIAQAAHAYGRRWAQISFKGTLDAVRQFSLAMSQSRSQRERRLLWDELLRILAKDLIPHRPGRREPRAIKRKKNKYPRLNNARHLFRDHPKRHERRARARLRALVA